MMLAALSPTFITVRGNIVNTASMAGSLNAPNMHNVSKTCRGVHDRWLYQDLQLVTDQIGARVVPVLVATPALPVIATDPTRAQAAVHIADWPGQRQARPGFRKVSGRCTMMVFDARCPQFYSQPPQEGLTQTRWKTCCNWQPDPFAVASPKLAKEAESRFAGSGEPTCADGVGLHTRLIRSIFHL
jgi:hypothetical protein